MSALDEFAHAVVPSADEVFDAFLRHLSVRPDAPVVLLLASAFYEGEAYARTRMAAEAARRAIEPTGYSQTARRLITGRCQHRQLPDECPVCKVTGVYQPETVGHYHDPTGRYDWCADPLCSRRQYPPDEGPIPSPQPPEHALTWARRGSLTFLAACSCSWQDSAPRMMEREAIARFAAHLPATCTLAMVLGADDGH